MESLFMESKEEYPVKNGQTESIMFRIMLMLNTNM